MRPTTLTIRENVPLTGDVYRMILTGDTGEIRRPGQFLNLLVPGFVLRRPISVCDWREGEVTLLYKVVGGGTEAMTKLPAGFGIDTLMGLGNGFDTAKSGDRPLLVGGGVGTPPLYGLCRVLREEDKKPIVLLGFRSKGDILLEKEFAALGAEVHIATEDGSAGTKGFVTQVMPELAYTYLYACGPLPMLRAVDGAAKTDRKSVV